MPGVMSTAGYKFANQCSDQAFARTDDQDRMARKCIRLLAWWREQAALRVQRHAHPRLFAVEAVSADRGANLAFDTIAAFRNAPFAVQCRRQRQSLARLNEPAPCGPHANLLACVVI
jgi:hypothetical protein